MSFGQEPQKCISSSSSSSPLTRPHPSSFRNRRERSQPPPSSSPLLRKCPTSALAPRRGKRGHAGLRILRPGVVRAGEEDRGEGRDSITFSAKARTRKEALTHVGSEEGEKREQLHSFALLWMRNDPIGLENFTSHTLYVHVCNLRRGPVLGEEVGLLFSSSSSSSFPSQSQ